MVDHDVCIWKIEYAKGLIYVRAPTSTKNLEEHVKWFVNINSMSLIYVLLAEHVPMGNQIEIQ